tara:strand:+ start:5055 stop:6329 length:1275 start_codon:yes stop_codon:yes gene_type:complete
MQLVGNYLQLSKISHIYLYVLFLGFLSLWMSPFLVSLVTVLSAIYVFVNYKALFSKNIKRVVFVSFTILLISIVDAFLDGFSSIVSSKLLLLVGFVSILASSFILFEKKKGNLIYFTLAISLVVAVINVIALSNYFMNMDFYDELLLQSKSIPIPNMHHIHFGIINACVIAVLVGLIVTKKLNNRFQLKLTTFLTVIITISFHVLSSRTGLLSFYLGVVVSLVAYAFQKKSYKELILGFLMILTSLTMSYYFSNSFRNKIENSIQDYNSWGKGDEINFKSMAMRIEASKMCIQIIKNNPFGVGANAQESILQATYVKENTPLDIENRVGPHNQFLDFGVKYGWVGIILLIMFFISLIPVIQQSSFPLVAVITIIFISLFFESLLERQTGIFLFSFFIPLSVSLFKEEISHNYEKNMTSNSTSSL